MAEITKLEVPPGLKEPVTIEIDTQGEGPLTAEASNESGEQSEVKVEKGEDGKHTVIFTPPSPATYLLSFKWGEETVTGSPLELNLNPPNSKAVTICDPPSGNLKPGESIKIGFDTSEAGRGGLESHCKAAETGDIPVQITQRGFSAKFDMEFLPPHEDVYTVTVTWAGKNVKGSPFQIDMNPILPSKVVASNFTVPQVPGGLIELDVCTEGAGGAELQASCKGDEVGKIPVNVKSTSKNNYHLSATTAPQPDNYTLFVRFAGQNIPDSPFTVNLSPSSDGVEHLTTIMPDSRDSPIVLKFDTSKAKPGGFRARVAGADSGPLDCTEEQVPGSDQEYQVTFVPPRADNYLVDVYWNDCPVHGSPFDVTILHPEKIRLGEPRFAELEIPVEMSVDASEAGPGTLTATCKGAKSGDMEVFVEDDLAEAGDKNYIISFRPSEYDVYTLSVFFDGTEVSKSPLVIDLKEPGKCFLFGLSPRRAFNIGDKVSFGVNAATAGKGKLNVTIDGPSSSAEESQVLVQSSEEDPHIYNIEYTPTACGSHKIHLKWGEESIPDSPLVFTVGDDSDVPTFPMTKSYVILFSTDCDPQEIRSYAIHEETGNCYDLTIGKRRNGKAKLTFKANLPGIHTLHLLIDENEIPGSPYRVKFVESDPSACKLVNLPDIAYVGEETSFKVDARKAGLGDLHVCARVPPGGTGTKFSHKDHNNGFYSIFLTPKVAGTHHFDINWAGTPIFNSPVELSAKRRGTDLQTAQEAASKVHVLKEDLYIFDMVLPSSLPAYVCISTGHAGKGKLSLKASGPSEAKVSIVDRQNGVYTAEIQPVVSGKYNLGILWNDIHIKGSPFKLNFTEEKSHVVNGLDLESVSFLIDVPYTFHIHSSQEDEGELDITCTPSTAASIRCEPLEHAPNSFLCEIVPKEVGNHEILIKYNDHEIFNSPCNVQFEQNADTDDKLPDDSFAQLDISIDMDTPLSIDTAKPSSDPVPDKVRAFGPGLSDGLVGQEGHFTVDTANAGEGKLEVDVCGPKGAFKINMRRHPDNDRTLLVRYDPKAVGKYTIDVLWAGEHVPGSPFSVNMGEQVSNVTELTEL